MDHLLVIKLENRPTAVAYVLTTAAIMNGGHHTHVEDLSDLPPDAIDTADMLIRARFSSEQLRDSFAERVKEPASALLWGIAQPDFDALSSPPTIVNDLLDAGAIYVRLHTEDDDTVTLLAACPTREGVARLQKVLT